MNLISNIAGKNLKKLDGPEIDNFPVEFIDNDYPLFQQF